MWKELANDLARVLNNRGIALAVQGTLDAAVADYSKAIDILSRLVEQEGRSELAHYLARTLNLLASLHAVDLRGVEAQGAVEYATRACKLTAWKRWKYIDTLAGAYAAASDFDKAVMWQTKAIELAPVGEKEELRQRLELYREEKP